MLPCGWVISPFCRCLSTRDVAWARPRARRQGCTARRPARPPPASSLASGGRSSAPWPAGWAALRRKCSSAS
eukprot:11213161-Lingulodinium_polyedra.AAC.1